MDFLLTESLIVFGVGRFRSVEVDSWRPTIRSVLERPTENDFFSIFPRKNSLKDRLEIDQKLTKYFVKLQPNYIPKLGFNYLCGNDKYTVMN